MGPRAKVATIVLLVIVLGLSLWQLTSPAQLPPVGTKYAQPGPSSSRGYWITFERLSYGSIFLAFSIANLTFPRPYLSTTYSVVISKVNETVTGSIVRSFSLRVTSLTLEDNYDGTTKAWGKTNSLSDAFQVTSLMHFATSANHELRFTMTYDLYNLLLFGYTIDHSQTRTFNITQNII